MEIGSGFYVFWKASLVIGVTREESRGSEWVGGGEGEGGTEAVGSELFLFFRRWWREGQQIWTFT